jgi:hypothetical protein
MEGDAARRILGVAERRRPWRDGSAGTPWRRIGRKGGAPGRAVAGRAGGRGDAVLGAGIIGGGLVGGVREAVAGSGASRRRTGRIGGQRRRRGGFPVPGFASRRDRGPLGRRKNGRESAGTEPGEEIDQGVDDAEQRQTDLRRQQPYHPALVPDRLDALAHLVEDERQVGGGAEGGGVGHAWLRC